MAVYRPPSYIAQRAAAVKRRLRPLGLHELHVTSTRGSRTVTVRWLDGPPPAQVRTHLAGEQARIVLRRTASDAAILEALRRGGSYPALKRWLDTADLSDLGPWASMAARILSLEPGPRTGSGWPLMRTVATALRSLSPAELETVLRLREDGSQASLGELAAVARALSA